MNLRKMLSGGDRRSIGQSDTVVRLVLKQPNLLGELMEAITDEDPLVRMRAADAAEKVTAEHKEWLQPHKAVLLRRIAKIPQQEVRWHVCQMLPRLKLSRTERRNTVELLKSYLDDKSGIVRTFAMQALFDFAEQDATLVQETRALLEKLTDTGTPAIKSRGKKLLAVMNKSGGVE